MSNQCRIKKCKLKEMKLFNGICEWKKKTTLSIQFKIVGMLVFFVEMQSKIKW